MKEAPLICGRYKAAHGRTAWCVQRPGKDYVVIDYDDGSSTVLPVDLFKANGFKEVKP